MSSDIPGFYFDAVQRRYFRIVPQTSNASPGARLINERARQEQIAAKQLNMFNNDSPAKKHRGNRKKKHLRTQFKLLKSSLQLLRAREYGYMPMKLCRYRLRSNYLERFPSTCLLDDAFSLRDESISCFTYDLAITSIGQCIQIIDHQVSLKLLNHPNSSYRLQASPVDGYQSSYSIGYSTRRQFMSTTLLPDENHVIVRFLDFFPKSDANPNSIAMLCDDSSTTVPDYFYQETLQTIEFSSSSTINHLPLRVKCLGPCAYDSRHFDRFAFTINNHLYVYDMNTFHLIHSIRVPVRRVTLTDVKFSLDNSNVLYTTTGCQLHQWDMREGNRTNQLPVICSSVRCLQTKINQLLTSSFDERVNLIDLRMPTQPVLIYDTGTTTKNPHFSFNIDNHSEHFVVACSQHHIAHIWELNTGRLLNRLKCPLPKRLPYASAQCAIACVDRIPIFAVYHPEYSRIVGILKT